MSITRRFVPRAEVSCDSNALAAAVGKANGRDGGPRHLTAWQAQMGERDDAIVMALGPPAFFARAMEAYRAAGLLETPARPLQPGLFDAVERGRAA